MQIDNTNNINFNRSINTDNNNTTKLAILTFGDTLKSQITTAKQYWTNMDLKLAFLLHVTG